MSRFVVLVLYVILVTVVAALARRKSQTRRFRALAEQPDALKRPASPRRGYAPVTIPIVAFMTLCAMVCARKCDPPVPQKFCVPRANCWSTGENSCEQECLLAENIVDALPIDDREVVALREFKLSPDETDARRVWAFERYTRSGEFLVTSFYVHGFDYGVPRLRISGNGNVEVELSTAARVQSLNVRLHSGRTRDWADSYIETTRLPETWHLDEQPPIEPVTIQPPFWHGDPGELIPARVRKFVEF